MTTAIAIREKADELSRRVAGAGFRRQVALALPSDVSTDRFVRAAITALMTNPDIAACDETSVFAGLLKGAQDGLLCDGREAALVKFGTEAAYMPMVGGFRKIAAEYGFTLRAGTVYEHDTFEYTEEPPKLVHHPVRPGAERGPIIAFYAVARRNGDAPLYKMMTKADVDEVRAVSRAANAGPWKDWYDRMGQKTVARSLFKELPLGDRERIQRVIEVSAPTPSEATELLYGPVHELTAAPSPDVTPEPSITSDSEGDDQQAEEAKADAESDGPSGDASSVPDPEPPLDEPVEKPAFEAPKGARAVAARVKELGATPVMGHEDKTLADLPPNGQWFEWALNGGSPQWTDEFAAIFEEYVQLAHPELWEAHQAENAGRQETLA